VISAIEGMAGIGKTQLAVHAGHLALVNYGIELVLFVNLRGFHDPVRFQKSAASVTWVNEATRATRMTVRRVVASALSDLRPGSRLAVVVQPILGVQ
jgi:predicted ATPase